MTCPACGLVREPGHAYAHPVRVIASGRCTACGRRLTLSFHQSPWSGRTRTRRLRCSCGTTNLLPLTVLRTADTEATDPCTGLPLWLAVAVRDRVLWAVNADHLTFMENHVAARLRETGSGNGRLASRLPAWITSSKNRDDILRDLARLRARLEA